MTTPLNGTKTHPLTPAAFDALAHLVASGAPVPCQSFNAGIIDRLVRGDGDGEPFAERVDLPSPFKSHRKGKTVPHLQITEAGRRALASRGAS